jgi:hypothetical protein
LADLVAEGIPGQPSLLRLDVVFKQLRHNLAVDHRPVPQSRAVNDAREFAFAYNAAPLEAQRDLERELTQRNLQLAVSDARVRALQAEADRLRKQAADIRPTTAGEPEPRDVVGQADRQIDDAYAMARTASPLTGAAGRERPERVHARLPIKSRLTRKIVAGPESRSADAAPPAKRRETLVATQDTATPTADPERTRRRASRTMLAIAAQAMFLLAGILAIIGAGQVGSGYHQTVSNSNYSGPTLLSAATISPYIVAAVAAILTAIAALVLLARKRRARWLAYAQAGIWLVALAGGIVVFACAHAAFEWDGQGGSLVGWTLAGEIPMFLAVALLVPALPRPAQGAS